MNQKGKIVFKIEYIYSCSKSNKRLPPGAYIQTVILDKRKKYYQKTHLAVANINKPTSKSSVKPEPIQDKKKIINNNKTNNNINNKNIPK